jgi:hypothetical protein
MKREKRDWREGSEREIEFKEWKEIMVLLIHFRSDKEKRDKSRREI